VRHGCQCTILAKDWQDLAVSAQTASLSPPRIDDRIANMTSERVRQLWKAEPFQKFTIHLADGRQIPVMHREFLMISPSGRTANVYQPDDSLNIVDLLLVTDLEVRPNGGTRRRGKRN